jgi:hypothetical protein
MDVEGKIPRALEALGPVAGRDVALVDVPGTAWAERVRAIGTEPLIVQPASPLRLIAQNESLDVVIGLWTSFRGVAPEDIAQVDRALRPGGRLLVVHDYGRDDVSTLRDPDAPEYRSWSRREGPFVRDAGFKIRVLHCFWTFPSLEEARAVLAEFGEKGETLGAGLKRPRLSWNVAVYHRWRDGVAPEGLDAAPEAAVAKP